jgi:2-amino-4-hydroxy-6-hydroxymethyldihydropteridine diphosphokinase
MVDALPLTRVLRASSVYETEPWGFASEHKFFNAVAELETELGPAELLEKLLQVEQELGRQRAVTEGYSDRLIDLDIIQMEGTVSLGSPELPHPRAAGRAFVLLPLAELRPDLRLGGFSVAELLAALPAEQKAAAVCAGRLEFEGSGDSC